jgi:integrase
MYPRQFLDRSTPASRGTTNLVDCHWRSTRTDAGIAHKLHDLRHYFASGLIAAGCDVVTVQRAMGHASAMTTLNTYAHLWPTVEDKTRAAASEMGGGGSCHASSTQGGSLGLSWANRPDQ